MMRRFHKVRVPASGHPLVRRLFEEMNRQQIGVLDMSERTGIGQSTMKHWRTMCTPSLANLEACYNVLGLELSVKPKQIGGSTHHGTAALQSRRTPRIGSQVK